MACGGKRSATPLSVRAKSSLYSLTRRRCALQAEVARGPPNFSLLWAAAKCFSLRVIEATLGAILNAAGIIIGGLFGLVRPQPLSAQTQAFFKVMLGAFTMFFGLRLTWLSVNGSFGQVSKQVIIACVALMLGNLLGKLLRLQKASNHLGQYAKKLIETNRPTSPHRFSNGMNACTILFCAAPLGILGAIQDSLPIGKDDPGYFYPLAVKALMDGLATMGFVMLFGVGAIFSALPVFVFLGTITMASHIYLEPFLRAHALLDPVNAVGGLVVCTVGVVIFEIRRVQLADYLPALVVAPLLTWLWK
jgi:uncharacterized protein